MMLGTYTAVCSQCSKVIFELKNIHIADCCMAAEKHGLTVTRNKNGTLGFVCRKCKKEASNERTVQVSEEHN